MTFHVFPGPVYDRGGGHGRRRPHQLCRVPAADAEPGAEGTLRLASLKAQRQGRLLKIMNINNNKETHKWEE